jgi:dTDP-3-amino-3,4,6-trideoxy-alpha-D-glucose transaminase
MTASPGVPFVTLDRQHAVLAADLRAAHERVVASGRFVLGPEVDAFEREFAAACGARHCVGVASGTAAITIALRAAGVGAGDEVVVPAHTYIASALGVLHAGATPVFCDVDAATGLIDPASAHAAVTRRTAAVLAVHLYGQACDMDALARLAARHGLLLFEDAAQAHGATWRGRRAGGIGAAAAFSFYPSKNLGALGDAGCVCTSDDGIAARARHLRDIGQRAKGEHVVAGFNERLDELQAAFLRVKLSHLDGWNRRRREHARRYRARLDGCVGMLGERAASPGIYHLFPVRVADRDAVARRLAAAGVQTGVHYARIVPDHPPFRSARRVGGLPAARAWAATELSLPMAPELDEAEVRHVADAVLASVRRAA